MLTAYLESTFEKDHTVIGSSSAPNEALSRSFINLVIFSCVLEERMLINNSKKKAQPQTSSSFAPPVTPPQMISESPASTSRQDICVYFETEIRQASVSKARTTCFQVLRIVLWVTTMPALVPEISSWWKQRDVTI